jgi:hypothetical protein
LVLDRYIVKDRVKLFSLVLPRDLVVIETIQVVYMLSSEMKSISIWSSVNSVGARQNDSVEKFVVIFLRDVV